MQNFEKIFDSLLRSALTADIPSQLVPEQYETLRRVYEDMYEVFGVLPEQKLFPNFASGSVSVSLPDVDLSGDALRKFTELLTHCNTFEILPLVNGEVRIAVTVPNVFRMVTNDNI